MIINQSDLMYLKLDSDKTQMNMKKQCGHKHFEEIIHRLNKKLDNSFFQSIPFY